ncbi:MAG: hypothetical protein U9R37_05700 [Campylobacterota bacterium]|nr:hypothetical protein [Campylobacterota bacterium]
MRENSNIEVYTSVLIIIALINIIFSTYFITILLMGVVFKIFLNSFAKGHYYISFLAFISFLVIENIQGFYIFSLAFIALTLYYFIIPRIKHIFSSTIMAEVIFVLLFYIGVLLINKINILVSSEIFITLLLNILFDSFIVGFML